MINQEETDRDYYEYLNSDEWKNKARARLQIDNYVCQGCGSRGNSLNMLQVHHLSYQNIYHEDIYHDLVTVCRSCHCILHNTLHRVINEQGQQGWKENSNIPSVNTFTLSGLDLNQRKGNLQNAKGNTKEL